MTRQGVYIVKETGIIWLVENVEYYEEGYSSHEFTIVTTGIVNGNQKIHRCYIPVEQYKIFEYLGPF